MIIHLVTDRHRLSPAGRGETIWQCVVRQARYAIDAGVDVIQIRERESEAGELFAATREIVRLSRGTRTRVVVSDRLDVAIAAEADGVHLPSLGLPPSEVRRIVPAGFLVGCSVHTPAEARAARGADYLIAGTVWATPSKPPDHQCLGTSGLKAIVRAAEAPVLAIGGVTVERAAEALEAGAVGMAAIGLFVGPLGEAECRAIPLETIVDALRSRFDTPGSDS